MFRAHVVAALTLSLVAAACGPSRTYVVEHRPETGDLIPHLDAAAKARGKAPQTDEESTVKFYFDEATGTRMYFNVKRKGLVLVVKVDEEKVPDEAARDALYEQAEAFGRELVTEAKAALERQREAEARAAEERARQEEARRRAEAAAPEPAAQPSPVTMPTMPNMPTMPGSRPPAGQQNQSTVYCCVNKRYYHCPSAAAVDRCVGRYTRCVSGCGLNGDCAMGCLKSDPPDPSMCRRDSGKDGQCAR